MTILVPSRRRFLFGASAAIVSASSLMAISTKAFRTTYTEFGEFGGHLNGAWRNEIRATLNINGLGPREVVWLSDIQGVAYPCWWDATGKFVQGVGVWR